MAQFNNLDTLSLLVASMCHDVGHDGFNNRYHVVAQTPLFQMYGAEHVQESLHAATTVRLMELSEFDFVSSSFSPKEIRLMKKRMIETILHTDMATMKQLREDFQAHLNKFNIKDQKNMNKVVDTSSEQAEQKSKQLISSVLIHSCDISTSLRTFDLSVQWAELLFEEFFYQGDTEKMQGMEISMMCDRTTTDITKGQSGFIQFVVLPIFYQLNEICPDIEHMQIAEGNANIESWKIRAEYERKHNERQEILSHKMEKLKLEEKKKHEDQEE